MVRNTNFVMNGRIYVMNGIFFICRVGFTQYYFPQKKTRPGKAETGSILVC